MSVVEAKILTQLGRIEDSPPIDTDGLDLSDVSPDFVRDNLSILDFAGAVELNVERYASEVVGLTGNHSQYTPRFTSGWRAHEVMHGAALVAVVDQTQPAENRGGYEKYRIPDDPTTKFIIGGLATSRSAELSKISDLVVNWTGEGHESTTNTLYEWFRDRATEAGETPIVNLVTRIIRQEMLHRAFYSLNAEHIASSTHPLLQKAARFIMRHSWSPVGVKMPIHSVGFAELYKMVHQSNEMAGRETAYDMIVRPLETLYSRVLDTDISFIRESIGNSIELARESVGQPGHYGDDLLAA